RGRTACRRCADGNRPDLPLSGTHCIASMVGRSLHKKNLSRFHHVSAFYRPGRACGPFVFVAAVHVAADHRAVQRNAYFRTGVEPHPLRLAILTAAESAGCRRTMCDRLPATDSIRCPLPAKPPPSPLTPATRATRAANRNWSPLHWLSCLAAWARIASI